MHVRCSLPRALVDKLVRPHVVSWSSFVIPCAIPFTDTLQLREHSMDKVLEIAHGSNHGAPLTIRANPLKVTRDDLIRRLKQNYAYEVRIVRLRVQHVSGQGV